jgi:hypothetical protein
MKTRADHISDLKLRLTGGKPSQDSDLDDRQLGKWVDDAYADLVSVYQKANGGEVSGAVYLWFRGITVNGFVAGETEKDDDTEYSCNLPASPLEFDLGAGIETVRIPGGVALNRIRPADVDVVPNLKFAKLEYCYYFVSGRLVVFLPFSYTKRTSSAKLDVLMAVAPTAADVPDNVAYPCPSSLVSAMLDKAEQIGRRQLAIVQDLVTDGKQQKQN